MKRVVALLNNHSWFFFYFRCYTVHVAKSRNETQDAHP